MAYIRFTNDGWYTRKPLETVLEGSLCIADACARIWNHSHAGSTVYVGLDTRAGSVPIADAVAGTLAGAGFRVVMPEGPCPMPAVDHAIAEDPDAAGGLIVGADHRSADYNGIRVRDRHGRAVHEDTTELIERIVVSEVGAGTGPVERRDLLSPFLRHLHGHFELVGTEAPLCVVDPLYGTARDVLASYLAGWGVPVVQIHGEPRGDFGDLHPDAVEPWTDECEHTVRRLGAGVGFVVDCPSNRVAVVDECGRIVPSPKVHALVMEHLVRDRGLRGRVVLPRAISSVVRCQAERLGLDVVTVGPDRVWASDEVKAGGVLTTADILGGLKVPSIDPTRDAFVTILCVLELLASAGRPLSVLVAELEEAIGPHFFGRRSIRIDAAEVEVLRNVLPGLNPGAVLGEEAVRVSHALGLEMTFADGSWFLIRASESEPLVRLLAEAPTREGRDALLGAAERIVDGVFPR